MLPGNIRNNSMGVGDLCYLVCLYLSRNWCLYWKIEHMRIGEWIYQAATDWLEVCSVSEGMQLHVRYTNL